MVFTPAWNRPPPPPPQPEPLPAPLPVGLVDEFQDRPWGSRGEMLPSQPASTTTTLSGLVIEPPDWEAEAAARDPEPPLPVATSTTALEAMMARAVELGEIDEPPALGPLADSYKPVGRVEIPEPHWRD